MFPISNRCVKQQEDSRSRVAKEPEIKLSQMAMNEYCPHLQNPIENFMESYIKNQIDVHQSHNYVGVQTDEYFEFPNFSVKGNWYSMNNNHCYDEFYGCKIKREEEDEQKEWPPQIKDEESPSANHEQGFQACQIAKQEEFDYNGRCAFEDPNKFLDPYVMASRQQRNYRRKMKVQAYLKKKNMRSFEKKIIYKCRKQVADSRIRYRGRFISINQAANILKLNPKQNYTSVELMEKLKAHNHLDEQKQQKVQYEEQERQLIRYQLLEETEGRNKKITIIVPEVIVKKNQEDE